MTSCSRQSQYVKSWFATNWKSSVSGSSYAAPTALGTALDNSLNKLWLKRFIFNVFKRFWPTLLSTIASVVCLSVRNVLWLNGASYSKSYYWQPIGSRIWEIDWYQNEWPWPLFRDRIKVTSTIALHSTLNISETVRVRGLFQWTSNRKWHMGYQMVTWLMASRDPERSNSWPQYA